MFLRHKETLWLLDIYSKRAKADLSDRDIKDLRNAVARIKSMTE